MIFMTGTIFFKGKPNPRIANAINITSPHAFRMGMKKLQRGGLSSKERSALVLGRNRATAQLMRKDLSIKERKQSLGISRTRIPIN